MKNAITKENVHIGSLYIYKSGKVALYLGRNEQGRYRFYTVGAIALFDEYHIEDVFTIYYEDLEFKYLLAKVNELMQRPMQKNLLAEMIGIPVLIYEIPFMSETDTYKLFAKRNLLGMESVQLCMKQDYSDIDNPQPIKPKDLKVGFVYIGKRNLGSASEGSPTVIYLGRSPDGRYKYLNLGGLSGLSLRNGFEYSICFYSKYSDHIELLKTPKTLYKPIYYRYLADIDTTPLLQKYKLI